MHYRLQLFLTTYGFEAYERELKYGILYVYLSAMPYKADTFDIQP